MPVADWLEPRTLLAFTAVTVDAANSGDVKAFADVDRDGYGDIILGGDSLSWYRYNPGGTWTKHVIRAAPIYREYTTDMQAGDIDGDGDPDIVVGDGSGAGNVLLFRNPGPTGDPTDGASWAVRVIGTHGSWAHDIEIGDVNNDEFVDIVTSGHGITHIWFQRPGAWPTVWQDKNLSALAGEGLALEDIDGDGDLDIATPEAWLETPAIPLLSDPTAYTWTRHVITGAAGETATTGDFNGDGRPDIATILQHANGKFAWYEQPADPRSANWPEHVIDNSQGSHKLVAADFNNDGLLDLMTGLELARINIYTNQGGTSPTFSNQQILNTGGHNARAGDIGNDGDIDIISCDYIGHPPLRVLINDLAPVANVPPKVTLRSPASQQMPEPGPLTLAAYAWDGDGSIERVEFYNGPQLLYTDYLAPYAVVQSLPSGIHQLRARAHDNFGGFTDSATVLVGSTPIGDANFDGRIDIDDYFIIDVGFARHLAAPRYEDGDFDHSGAIDADDYFLIDRSYIGQNEAGGVPMLVSGPAASLASPSTAALSALGADDGGESNLTYTWSVLSGPSGVVFSRNGTNAAKSAVATFPAAGDYTLRLTLCDPGGRAVVAEAPISVAAQLTSIEIFPASAAVPTGAARQFTASPLDQFGDPISPAPGVTWSLESGVGSIDSSGLYSAPASGTGSAVVRAEVGAISDTASISIADESVLGLLARYSFDEGIGGVAVDGSANQNDGYLSGAIWTAAGKSGTALDFDGIDDRVAITPTLTEDFNIPGSALTLAAWIKPDDFGESDARIISKATGTAEQDHVWMLSTYAISGGIGLRFRLETGTNTTTLIASSGVLTAGQWAHVAATYDGTTMRLYLNGVLVGSTAKTGAVASSAADAWIGDNPPGGGRAFDGLIDEVRIYSRALTQEELAALAAA